MNTYAAFAFNGYYPSGGWDDFVGRFDTLDEAKAAAVAAECQYGQIVDLATARQVLWGERLEVPGWRNWCDLEMVWESPPEEGDDWLCSACGSRREAIDVRSTAFDDPTFAPGYCPNGDCRDSFNKAINP